MVDTIYNVLGYIGMSLIIVSLVPQLIKTHQRKQVQDISIFFPLIQITSGCCMIPYAISIKSYQVLTIQCAVSTNSLILLYQILRYRKPESKTPLPISACLDNHNSIYGEDNINRRV